MMVGAYIEGELSKIEAWNEVVATLKEVAPEEFAAAQGTTRERVLALIRNRTLQGPAREGLSS